MSLPAVLVPVARSAFRDIVRAANITFQGDHARRQQLLTAVRATFTSPTFTPPSNPLASSSSVASSSGLGETAPQTTQDGQTEVNEEQIAKRIAEWKEVAQFLRKNVVQGVQRDDGSYELRVTPETELGDNTSLKNPQPMPTKPFPNRGKRRRGDEAQS